jgi:hypothetical protein
MLRLDGVGYPGCCWQGRPTGACRRGRSGRGGWWRMPPDTGNGMGGGWGGVRWQGQRGEDLGGEGAIGGAKVQQQCMRAHSMGRQWDWGGGGGVGLGQRHGPTMTNRPHQAKKNGQEQRLLLPHLSAGLPRLGQGAPGPTPAPAPWPTRVRTAGWPCLGPAAGVAHGLGAQWLEGHTARLAPGPGAVFSPSSPSLRPRYCDAALLRTGSARRLLLSSLESGFAPFGSHVRQHA